MLWLRLLGVIVFLVPFAWTSEARACSCGREPDDRVAFQQARARASTVFRGRVEELQRVGGEGRPLEYRATFAVTETFKGKARPQRLVTTSVFGTACGYDFEKGVDYLVYAEGSESKGLSTHSCSRTRPADRAAAELDFLRGGASPFLQRSKVSCTRCDLEATARVLVCPGAGPCAPLPEAEVAAALAEARPFWTLVKARAFPQGPVVSGVAPGGRAFQLELRRPSQADEACVHRVVRRWCERLVPGSETEPGLKCVGPSGEGTLCDERTTRRPPR
ncbi:putative lipoprotein [Cystobacter fuscus DSM 2262]|uniref:Lipoprotein n=1 Tax=Cystobacter fuscus (strain ATCC 25194 / DSM 2262 / NBRC 100088 / M29) TaxID=1242864 RepID=S9P326_CYSF2|nr:hypothetical protein [Cystobacter fuscus]EPX56627.1 putative lipoprotein [Cystobacter fuscus DSM 2262]